MATLNNKQILEAFHSDMHTSEKWRPPMTGPEKDVHTNWKVIEYSEYMFCYSIQSMLVQSAN